MWEHNTHIGDARATDMARDGLVNVGQLLRERHADEGVALEHIAYVRMIVEAYEGLAVVVSPDAVATPAPAGTDAGATTVIDLNSATVSDLDSLPGVGPVMAGRILDWRTAHGRFTSIDQLREVSGIGARTFERLKPHVRV